MPIRIHIKKYQCPFFARSNIRDGEPRAKLLKLLLKALRRKEKNLLPFHSRSLLLCVDLPKYIFDFFSLASCYRKLEKS